MPLNAAKYLVVALALLLLAPAARGAEKIAFVDIEKITGEADFVQELVADIEKRLDRKRDDVEALREDYDALRQEIESKRTALKDEELEQMIQRSRKLRLELEDAEFDLNRMLRDAEREQMDPALDYVLETIRAIGREGGYELILRGEVVLYGADSADISGEVVERLNRDYRDGKIDFVGKKSGGRASREDGERRPALSVDE